MEDNSDSDDSLTIAQKSWIRRTDAASKAGYREGVEEGSQAVLQENFDIGYEDGFRAAFELGKYKALATIFFKDQECPAEIARILEKTRRGACHICTTESGKSDESNLSSEETIEEHRRHVQSTLKTLREYFEVLMKERGINVDQLASG